VSAERTSERTKVGLVSLGVALAAAGIGAAAGLAGERLAVGRPLLPRRGESVPEVDYTSLHVPGRWVEADDGVALYVEVDELPPEPRAGRGKGSGRTADGDVVTLIFSHGFALTMDAWFYQRRALRGRYRMVFWEQRGHGRSETGTPESCTLDQAGADLYRVIQTVAPKGPIVLVSHSMGGMSTLAMAARRPSLFAQRVLGVALVATSAGGLGALELGMAGLGRLVQRVAPGTLKALSRSPRFVENGRRVISDIETVFVRRYSYVSAVSPDLVAFTAQMIAETPVEVISAFLPTFQAHDKRAALSVLDGMEVLVLVGDSDLMTPPSHSRDIVRQVPTAELVVVPHSGHMVMLEYPQLVTEHLESLITRAARGHAAAPRGIIRRRLRRPDGAA
jgi:pimeloyl-ACP methyl ester carboxylesterase